MRLVIAANRRKEDKEEEEEEVGQERNHQRASHRKIAQKFLPRDPSPATSKTIGVYLGVPWTPSRREPWPSTPTIAD